MNRFAILNLLALYCISFAPAQAGCEKYKVIDARFLLFDCIDQESTNAFYRGDVQLYKIVDAASGKTFYKVGENASRFSRQFLIEQRYTVVIKNEVLIKYQENSERMAIKLIMDMDPFAFYRELFAFENFPEEFRATRITLSVEQSEITTIKAKNGPGREWNLVALAGDTPVIIFPIYLVTEFEKKALRKKVSLTVKAQVDHIIPIVVEFDSYADANRFNEFLKEWW